ncbi:MAG: oligosaccharide flippase family protein [Acidobacteria bacterium]|nr:oligosaccharide flippase family protein [Acidobacteriota bacterium]
MTDLETRVGFSGRMCTLWHRFKRASSFRSHVALTMATNITLLAISVVTGSLAARLLGPHGRGELAAIQNWPGVLATLGSVGLPQAVIYYTGRQPELSGRILVTATTVLLALSLPMVSIGYLIMPSLLQAQSWNIIQEARLYLLLVPILFLGLSFYTLQGRSDFVAWNPLRLAAPLLWLGILVLSLVTQHRTPGFLARSYLLTLALLIPAIGYWVITSRVSGPYVPDLRLVGPMLRFGIPATLTVAPQLLSVRLDQLMMAALLPAEALGLYAVAATWGGSFVQLLSAVASVIFPRVASSSDSDRARATFARTVRLSVVLALPIGVLLACGAPLGIPLLFGTGFLPAVLPAVILVASGVVHGLNQIIEGGLQGLGLPRTAAVAETTGLGVSAASLIVLLPRYRLTGAAAASLVSSLATLLLLLWSAQHEARCSARTLLCVRRGELALALAQAGNSLSRWVK